MLARPFSNSLSKCSNVSVRVHAMLYLPEACVEPLEADGKATVHGEGKTVYRNAWLVNAITP